MTSNRDYLSQEEIDALLRQTSDDSGDAGLGSGRPELSQYLSGMEQDALGEIGNITFGSAATALSTLLGKKVDITTPQVSLLLRSELQQEFPKPHVTVHVNYVDGFHGINLLVIKIRDAQVIADLMMGGDGTGLDNTELNDLHISAVQEAMNQMMGSSATSMSTIFNRMVNISPPGIDIMDLTAEGGKANLPAEEVFVKISFRLKIGDLIDSNIMQLLPVDFSKEMVNILMGGSDSIEPEPAYAPPSSYAPPAASGQMPVSPQADPAPAHVPPAAAAPGTPPGYDSQQAPPGYPPQQNPYYPPPGYSMPAAPYGYPPYAGQPMGIPAPAPGPQNYGAPANRNVNVQPAQFSGFTPGLIPPAEEGNLNLLMDIPLKVTVELGRSKMLIKDILQLSQGSIIELDKLAGEPVDILVNNKLIAKGEVVVIDENFGVRVTDIINQWERIQKIQ
ncbi:flagellar motor switch phosphatase FliY [Gorillibacterium sp. sgz500922]|uniref:flagellar motor switch phosphatase FliY n=1 Tax=Gorillibacterium sp. sgz500922 TaxID=3446694 RepID=UPI003F67CCF0